MSSESDIPQSPHDHYVPGQLPDDVAWGFTVTGLQMLRHYAHPIPHAHGFVKPFMNLHWPGLDWQRAMSLASNSKVWIKTGRTFTGLEEAPNVKEFHLLRDGTTRVIVQD